MRDLGNGHIARHGKGVPFGTGPTNQIMDFRYVTNDDAATVEATGFFNAMAAVAGFKVGSMIYTSLDVDGTPAGRIYMVTVNDGTAVTVAPIAATAIA